jgi:hypothetical protein
MFSRPPPTGRPAVNNHPQRDCVTIRKKPSFRTNPALRDEIRNPEFTNVNRLLLDPGSRPASRDLAGMTNCDTVSKRVA